MQTVSRTGSTSEKNDHEIILALKHHRTQIQFRQSFTDGKNVALTDCK